jgi:hypothetical protein
MTGPQGPFLYDDGPEPLHTGTPRRSGRWLVAIFGATVLAAVLLVVLLSVVKGSAEDQAREVTGVFLAALDNHDTETAYGLLCQQERDRLDPGDIAGAYVEGDGVGTVVSVTHHGSSQTRQVHVEWPGGGRATYDVVNSDGGRICGAH